MSIFESPERIKLLKPVGWTIVSTSTGVRLDLESVGLALELDRDDARQLAESLAFTAAGEPVPRPASPTASPHRKATGRERRRIA
ncbi:hypothetical protein GCM10011490_06820 [Pseudoclavibacter endophyticus]|uniref:Uncharacterized protein n=1 Tax=Pseudoclavibacter endophyticus TaxID=1778590 RepID=A0A6H9WQ55_9MICO|nr:hypothetical protein [Pseudoclavibacter endophyticus]KAB1649831.1 hypothetical protein F8O04_06275 [Pseudoclavibacter endophyticus]GGA59434.1 hypothetical protein GCM10011490_06820 [Pseudoclavibacter endophyticus]